MLPDEFLLWCFLTEKKILKKMDHFFKKLKIKFLKNRKKKPFVFLATD